MKPAYRRSLSLVFVSTSLLSFLSAGVFIFYLVAGLSSDLARHAGGDQAQLAYARMIARDRAVGAASQAIAFLLAQAVIQAAALVLSSRIATRGLEAEFARMRLVIGEQERRLSEAAALSGWKEVASFLSHQLKNPLAAIDLCQANALAAVERMGERAGGDAMGGILDQSLRAIGEEAARMKALIARLRSLTAFQEPVFGEAGLGALAREVCAAFPPGRLDARVEGEAIALIDRDLAAQALRNLVDNSIEEAQAAGALPVRVELRVEAGEGGPRIAFDDSNSGVTAELAERLGKARFTSKKTGSGLGLLFVSRIMAIHSGSFRAEATERGSLRIVLTFAPPAGADRDAGVERRGKR